ncbi:Gfo/Idh/MocA family protein [Flagellimonas meridianipacifica]|uniref:Putative dehydrogenase n=1 Tax=Flagellimonas meridianipacifica TaxID=1080225 RepID=A0A2T0M8P6_9FLAO|nr:Gfo/Idh/MocA family oxidoreductase [Allomuricauda pacifica]PRX53849.1 putative dehydrogenase [Allomuricauda pacifica]
MKRRDFITKTGLAASTVVCATSVFSMGNIHSANDTINIGVIGTGDRGGGLIPILNEIPKLRVTACCDTIPFRLRQGLSLSKRKTEGYEDYRKLLDNKQIDAVLIATPFSTHARIAMDAVDAGKHVYCEKTMGKGYGATQNLVAKVQTSNVIFQTGHQYHSSRLYNHVVNETRQGRIGKITAIECQWNRNGNWRRPVPDPKWERMINWRMYREFSGGLLAELCSHQLDFANWVLEDKPEKVMGIGGVDYWKDGRETYDNIHLIYSYPKGVKATFTCLTSNAMGDYKIRVMGDKGSFTLDYTKAWYHPETYEEKELGEVDGVSGATLNWEQGKGIPVELEHQSPSTQALMDFRDSIHSNTQPISNVHSGAVASVCVQMGLDAMYEQRIVHWNSNALPR